MLALILVILIFVFIIIYLTFIRKKNNGINNLPIKIPTTFISQKITPLGTIVISVVDYENENILKMIDEGISGAIRSYQHINSDWIINRSDIMVMMIDPQATNINGSPAVIVNGIQSAGTVLGVGSQANLYSPITIVIPHQKDTDWAYLRYLKFSVWNEMEHCIEWLFNKPLFYTYAVENDIHPHVPRIYLEGEEVE